MTFCFDLLPRKQSLPSLLRRCAQTCRERAQCLSAWFVYSTTKSASQVYTKVLRNLIHGDYSYEFQLGQIDHTVKLGLDSLYHLFT